MNNGFDIFRQLWTSRMSGKEDAMREKELGNGAYKKKDFQTAIQHYSKVNISSFKSGRNALNKKKIMIFYFQHNFVDKCASAVVEKPLNHLAKIAVLASYGQEGDWYRMVKLVKNGKRKLVKILKNCQNCQKMSKIVINYQYSQIWLILVKIVHRKIPQWLNY